VYVYVCVYVCVCECVCLCICARALLLSERSRLFNIIDLQPSADDVALVLDFKVSSWRLCFLSRRVFNAAIPRLLLAVMNTLDHCASRAQFKALVPGMPGWIDGLSQLVARYFQSQASPETRVKVS
jgi:hypothetical protein